MTDCIFCKIISGDIPVQPVAENENAILIKDKNPLAPHHVLAISRPHAVNCAELDHYFPLLDMFVLINEYAEKNGLNQTGYRLVSNSGKDAGQTVPHFHIHLLGGAELKNDFGAK